jgi:hypothetical protein
MDVNQAKTENGQEAMKAAIRSSQKESEAKTEEKTKAYRGPTEACLGKWEATIKTCKKQMRAEIRAGLRKKRRPQSRKGIKKR